MALLNVKYRFIIVRNEYIGSKSDLVNVFDCFDKNLTSRLD